MTIRETTALIYPDEYIVEQDQMGISAAQTSAVRHAVNVLEPYYAHLTALLAQAEAEAEVEPNPTWVATELNHYHSGVQNSQKLIVPDIAVFAGLDIPLILQKTLPSWDMRGPNHRPPPPLVIEICSPETYDGDILPHNKPRLYGLVGVREYFAYDPNVPRVWPMRGPHRIAAGVRLLGWRYEADGSHQPIEASQQADREGWLWSEVLGLWLVPNGGLLEFYTDEGERLPDRDEITQQARHQAQQQAQARQEAEQARQQAEQARQQAEQARQQAEQTALREVQARQQAEQAALRATEARQEAEQVTLQEVQARQQAEQATLREAQARQEAEQATLRATEARQQAEQATLRATEARQQAEQREAQARQQAEQAAQRQAETDQQLADLQRQLDEMRRRLSRE